LKTTQNLSLSQRIRLRIIGEIFLRMEKREGWTNPLPIYLVRCPKHGLFETYPQGFDDKLRCPSCLQELFNFVAALNKEAAFLYSLSLDKFYKHMV